MTMKQDLVEDLQSKRRVALSLRKEQALSQNLSPVKDEAGWERENLLQNVLNPSRELIFTTPPSQKSRKVP